MEQADHTQDGKYKRLNQLLLACVERIDSQFAEYNEKHPYQITADVVSGFLADKPLARRDQGKDFVEFTLERLSSNYSRNRIGRSRYENAMTGCMRNTTKNGTNMKRRLLYQEINVTSRDAIVAGKKVEQSRHPVYYALKQLCRQPNPVLEKTSHSAYHKINQERQSVLCTIALTSDESVEQIRQSAKVQGANEENQN